MNDTTFAKERDEGGGENCRGEAKKEKIAPSLMLRFAVSHSQTQNRNVVWFCFFQIS